MGSDDEAFEVMARGWVEDVQRPVRSASMRVRCARRAWRRRLTAEGGLTDAQQTALDFWENHLDALLRASLLRNYLREKYPLDPGIRHAVDMAWDVLRVEELAAQFKWHEVVDPDDAHRLKAEGLYGS